MTRVGLKGHSKLLLFETCGLQKSTPVSFFVNNFNKKFKMRDNYFHFECAMIVCVVTNKPFFYREVIL